MIPAQLIGKKCWLRGEATLVFDWSKVPAREQTRFLADLFDDHRTVREAGWYGYLVTNNFSTLVEAIR
jgi:hypothetical protein